MVAVFQQSKCLEADPFLPHDPPLNRVPHLHLPDPSLLPLQNYVNHLLSAKLHTHPFNLHPDTNLPDPYLPVRPGVPVDAPHRADQAGPLLHPERGECADDGVRRERGAGGRPKGEGRDGEGHEPGSHHDYQENTVAEGDKEEEGR